MAFDIGDPVPSISLKDKNGNNFQFDDLKGKSPFVVYFYPKNFTPGCTAEACDFRDQYQEFKNYGAEVIAISSDSESSHRKFADHYNLPFIFLSDKQKKARKAFAVRSSVFGLIPGRETFIFDKKGVLRMRYNNLSASEHTNKALQKIKELQEQ